MNPAHPTSSASRVPPPDTSLRVVLAAGDILRLMPTRLPATVACIQGTCWLTQEGDALDHLLGIGMAHVLGRRGLTLIQAFSDCVVELPSEAVRGSRRSAA